MSSAQNSHLTLLGYDMVLATTQGALNATMTEYLKGTDRLGTSKCWIKKAERDPQTHKVLKIVTVEIALDDLMKMTNGISPFDIDQDADPSTDTGLQQLAHAGFAQAYLIKPGIPPGMPIASLPNIIELGASSANVTYNMLCSEAKVCTMDNSLGFPVWTVYQQPLGQSWGFQCKVDLRMEDDIAGSAFAQLPESIKETMREAFGGEDAFSVQQLLFDLDNAGLETVPSMQIFAGDPNIDPEVAGLINGSLLGNYYAEMKTKGQPLLHVAAVSTVPDTSEFRATAMDMVVCQLRDEATGEFKKNLSKDEQNLSTLNYVCMAQKNPMPQARPLPLWNWISESESEQWDGVIAYQRDSFANYLKPLLINQVLQNCYMCQVQVVKDDGSIPRYYFGLKNLGGGATIDPDNREWIRDQLNSRTGSPDFHLTDASEDSSLVMEWDWSAESSDDTRFIGIKIGSMDMKPSYKCTVTFVDNQIIIFQNLKVNVDIMKEQDEHSADVVNWERTDTYTLTVDSHGNVTTRLDAGQLQDHSENLRTNPFFNAFNTLNDVGNTIRDEAQFISTGFHDFPVDVAQKFQFPGGKTFAFREFKFSKFQDLTAAITYVDPVQ